LLLAAAFTVVALVTLPAPASALTVTAPTAPAPLPIELPLGASAVGGSVSGGAGGAPIDVTVKGPASTGVEVQLPGIPSAPALPIGPTAPTGQPIASRPVGPSTQSSSQPASLSRPGGSDSSVAVPGDLAAALPPSPFAAGPAAAVAAPEPLRSARVSAVIDARPADSLLHRVQGIASRLALWALLAAVVFVLEWQVGSAVRRRRTEPAGLS
jgi:hypothetical protein